MCGLTRYSVLGTGNFSMNTSELIYDWNKNHPPGLKPAGPVQLNDESLRDGLQSPSVRDPSIAEKIEILHLMEVLGIDSLDLGLPGAGLRAVEHVTALAREIVTNKMKIRANCAARTHENDIRPIAEIVQKTGLRIEAATFIGSSPAPAKPHTSRPSRWSAKESRRTIPQ